MGNVTERIEHGDLHRPTEFELLLQSSGLTKADLARALGITAGSVSRWGRECPEYAAAYLRLRVELERLGRATLEGGL